MLSATARLTRGARKWYDLNLVSINNSWSALYLTNFWVFLQHYFYTIPSKCTSKLIEVVRFLGVFLTHATDVGILLFLPNKILLFIKTVFINNYFNKPLFPSLSL